MSGLLAAGRTHRGRVRPHNEDAFVCEPDRGLLAVIDGMGGEAAGEVAAAITRDQVLRGGAPRQALADANAAILARGEDNPDEGGMGCVATAARLDGSRLSLAHVGDTRAYLISAAGLELLTRDHTVVAEMREKHGMTEEQARALPGQHRVTRDIGGHHREGLDWIDAGEVDLQVGDVLLMCSDGLHDLVRDGELSRLLSVARRERSDPTAVVDDLVELALARGGHDNVTVVVARFEGAPKKPTKKPPRSRSEPAPAEEPPKRRSLLRSILALFLAVLAFFVGRASVPEPEPLLPPPPEIVREVLPQQWQVADGQELLVQGAVIDAGEGHIAVTLGTGSTLRIASSTITAAQMAVSGPEDAAVILTDATMNLPEGAPTVVGPTLSVETP